ncbi:MAG: hypothetical protein R2715_16715 [Ilumatobacteraceae bacterium]
MEPPAVVGGLEGDVHGPPHLFHQTARRMGEHGDGPRQTVTSLLESRVVLDPAVSGASTQTYSLRRDGRAPTLPCAVSSSVGGLLRKCFRGDELAETVSPDRRVCE